MLHVDEDSHYFDSLEQILENLKYAEYIGWDWITRGVENTVKRGYRITGKNNLPVDSSKESVNERIDFAIQGVGGHRFINGLEILWGKCLDDYGGSRGFYWWGFRQNHYWIMRGIYQPNKEPTQFDQEKRAIKQLLDWIEKTRNEIEKT